MPAKRKSITHFRLDPAQPPTLTPEQQAVLDATPIDYSDIPELPDDFWTHHPPVKRENKRMVSLRLDADVLAFFQKQGEGYQTQINAVLRSYVEAHSRGQVSLSEPDRTSALPTTQSNRARAHKAATDMPSTAAHSGHIQSPEE